MSNSSTEIVHTLPSGDAVTFHVTLEREHRNGPVVWVEYASDEDFGKMSSSQAYPEAAIESWASEKLGSPVVSGGAFHHGPGRDDDHTEEGWTLEEV